MGEFITVLAVVMALGGFIYIAAVFLDKWAWRMEQFLNLAANAMILFVMFFVTAEVFMRKVFNSPIPGHLEWSELFMPAIVFFAMAYTQSTGGHVQMMLVIERLPPPIRRAADVITLALSVFIYAILTYFSAKFLYRTWEYDDITMTPPYTLIWPSTAAVTVGLFFTSLRLYLDFLRALFPGRIQRLIRDPQEHLQFK